ncbi:hypothetical protein VNO80_03285 [Phaseolus coccineus]|uniref:Uncharacterized protein n=1 Tax=Phaseolus coccineus TaxID=3886 RepID=A0AAN9RNH0_PHACN
MNELNDTLSENQLNKRLRMSKTKPRPKEVASTKRLISSSKREFELKCGGNSSFNVVGHKYDAVVVDAGV